MVMLVIGLGVDGAAQEGLLASCETLCFLGPNRLFHLNFHFARLLLHPTTLLLKFLHFLAATSIGFGALSV